MEILDDDYCELEASTRHGNASRAAAIAKKLAEKKVPVSVRISELPLGVPETPIKYATSYPFVVIYCKCKGSPYSIAELRVLELIPVLGSQPAGDVS